MPLGIGPLEVIIVLIIALVILGPKRLPDAGRSLGEGLRGFRRSLTGADDRGEPLEVETADERSAAGR
jgi:sec-independent protein translocase protein TatA